MNNHRALREGKPQYVFLLNGKDVQSLGTAYLTKAKGLRGNPRLTPTQATNLELNLQLVEMEAIRHEKGTTDDDDVFDGTNAAAV